jgi:hypothetical protein
VKLAATLQICTAHANCNRLREPKGRRGQIHRLNLSLTYVARTGWSSGRLALTDGATIDVMLPKAGDNTFKLFAFDPSGGPVGVESNRIVITRTAATIDAIPASSSIFVEVLSALGGPSVPAYLVKEGEPLPKTGRLKVQPAEALRARGARGDNCRGERSGGSSRGR